MQWSERTVPKKIGPGQVRTWFARTDESSCIIHERDDGHFTLDAWSRDNQTNLSGTPFVFPSLEQAQVFADRLMDHRPDQWERLVAEDLV